MSDNSTPEQGDHLLTISEAADLLGTAEVSPPSGGRAAGGLRQGWPSRPLPQV